MNKQIFQTKNITLEAVMWIMLCIISHCFRIQLYTMHILSITFKVQISYNTYKGLNKLPSISSELWRLLTFSTTCPSPSWSSSQRIFFLGATFSPSCLSLLEICAGETLPSGSRTSAIRRLQCRSSLNLKRPHFFRKDLSKKFRNQKKNETIHNR